jgi:osmoprotectant transport system substrate-binding protein
VLNRNIGPTEVTIQAIESGRLDMYPEYLTTWNRTIAGDPRQFRTARGAYHAGQGYAKAHGLQLLDPSPFSDTDAIGVLQAYAIQNGLSSLDDLRKVALTLTIGAPPQFQQSPTGLPAIEQAYGFIPVAFKALDIGAQYQALDQGTVQAADVNTTDGELASGNYVLLSDRDRVFGFGNVVPVVSAKVALAEGPAFVATINRVTALLSTDAIRLLNAAVDIQHEDPAAVAKQFLLANGLLTPSTP